MTDEQIKKMVDRFLGWQLPKDFSPDCGISFDRKVNLYQDGEVKECERYDAGPGWWPVGTNLFSADEAEEMIRYILSDIFNDGSEEHY